MAIYTGKVISVALDVDYPKQDGSATYKAFILKYVDDSRQIREIVKPMQGLKYKAPIRTALGELTAGDKFSVQVEDGKNGYKEIVALVKGDPSVEMAAQAASQTSDSASKATQTGKVLGSNYETPEERALRREADKVRQRLIVRQSSFDQARQSLGQKVKLEEVFAAAQEIETWVYRGIE